LHKQKSVVNQNWVYRSVQILNVDNLQFKDLNKNGKLDPYEDWRLPYGTRSKDLLSKMSIEEKVGFMLISTTRMKNDWSFEAPKGKDPIASGFNEEDLVQSMNMFTKKPLPVAMTMAAGTTKGVTQSHLRHFILRANVSARTTAEWANNLQALCEQEWFGHSSYHCLQPQKSYYQRCFCWIECWYHYLFHLAG